MAVQVRSAALILGYRERVARLHEALRDARLVGVVGGWVEAGCIGQLDVNVGRVVGETGRACGGARDCQFIGVGSYR